MYHRIEVLFCDKNVPSDPGFKMVLSQRHTYAEMTARVAERLNTDPECIQFFRTTNYRDCPGNPLRCDTQGTLKDFLSYNKPRMAKKLFYQLLSIKVFELDRKKQIRCVWMSMNCREEKEIVLYPNKNGTVRDLLDEAVASPHVQLVGREGGGTGTLRLLEVAAYKIQSVQRDDAPLESLNVSAQKQFRIEEVPLEEALVAPGELVLPCAHFHKEIYSNFGVPFYVKIREGEKLSSVRERIQKRLEVPEKEFEKWRLALVSGGKAVYLNDEDASIRLDDFVVVSGTMPSKLWLGLDHVNKAPKKSRYNYLEKAIKIHN